MQPKQRTSRLGLIKMPIEKLDKICDRIRMIVQEKSSVFGSTISYDNFGALVDKTSEFK